ncbi:nickel/cobalt transporter [Oceaniglobus indicus]|uniref:nickel/cobalt transporter n=1 Tax=Oceaniglobus indicus TaxID=2047749 RepID=UPI000C1A7F78|nr:hypothetical protein [Oceaniglobus indicus]
MRRTVLIPAFGAIVLAIAAFWAAGGIDTLAAMAESGQRHFQNAMAGALRALRAGDPGAFMALLGVCFGYGVLHAAGPGHGKAVIGGYGVARRVAARRLAIIAVAASLAQSLTAVVLVGTGVLVLGWSRERMVDVAETLFAPLSYGAIGLLGLWLMWRGGRRLWALQQAAGHHHAGDGGPCPSCGHRHGPDPGQVGEIRSLRDAALLIAGIAMRPCTGALFLLIVTWRMDVFAAGIAGTFAMGLGTASVTVAVALSAVGFRAGALASLGGGRAARVAMPLLECLAGSAVALAAFVLVSRSLAG